MAEEFYNHSVLIIEDDKTIRENYVTFLKKYFKAVWEAEDGEMGYDIYKQKKPDILVIDIGLPKLSGLDLLKKLREKDHTTKAIMLTAYSSKDYLLDAAELKLTKYLVKPASRKDLKKALATCISELINFQTVSKKIIQLKEGFHWNLDSCELFANKKVHLTKNETKFLEVLFSNPYSVHFYERIILKIWEYPEDDKKNALKTLVKNVRKKMPEGCIDTVFDSGYRIRVS